MKETQVKQLVELFVHLMKSIAIDHTSSSDDSTSGLFIWDEKRKIEELLLEIINEPRN